MPPGRTARTSSAATSSCRGANIAPKFEVTASNAPSGTGSASASPATQSMPAAPTRAARARPASSSSGVRSIAVTAAPAWAAGIATFPSPAATSRSRTPGAAPARRAVASPAPASRVEMAG